MHNLKYSTEQVLLLICVNIKTNMRNILLLATIIVLVINGINFRFFSFVTIF